VHDGVEQRHAVRFEAMGELDDENAVGHDHTDHHQNAHQRLHVERRLCDEQRDQHSRQTRRHREQNQHGIRERPELRDQNQVEQDQRQDQSEREAPKRRVHPFDHPPHVEFDAAGKIRSLDDAINRGGEPAEVFARRIHVNVDHAPDLVVVDLGR
jgi:hypothetical protein